MNHHNVKNNLSTEEYLSKYRSKVDSTALLKSGFASSLREKINSEYTKQISPTQKFFMVLPWYKLLISGLVCIFITFITATIFLRKNEHNELVTILSDYATLEYEYGELEYLNNSEWELLNDEVVLTNGSSIRSTSDDFISVNFKNGSSLSLDKNTQITLQNLSLEEIKVNNDNGTIFAKIIDSDQKFTVTIDNTEYTALGTIFEVINLPYKKGLKVYESSVAVRKLGEEDNIDLVISEGKKYFEEVSHDLALQNVILDINPSDISENKFTFNNIKKDKGNLLDKIDESESNTIAQDIQDEILENIELHKTDKIELKSTDSTFEGDKTNSQGRIISLSGIQTHNGIKLEWTTKNIETSEGFAILTSQTSYNPSFPNDLHVVVDNPDTNDYLLVEDIEGPLNIRVCNLTKGVCDKYSNKFSIKLEQNKNTPTQIPSSENQVEKYTKFYKGEK